MSEELLVEFNKMIPKKDEIRPPEDKKYIYLVFGSIIAITVGFILWWGENMMDLSRAIYGIGFFTVAVTAFVLYDVITEKKLRNKFDENFTKILQSINIADHETLIKDEQVDGIRSIYNIEMKPDYKKNEYYLIIHTLRPGILIGLRGANIKKLQKFLAYDFGYEPRIELEEPTIFKNIYKR